MKWASAFLFALGLAAQPDTKTIITGMYGSTVRAMREARTAADMERLMNAMDAPEWLGELPAGTTLTRSDAAKMMEQLLSVPPEKRPIPEFHFLYFKENGWNARAIYWVYARSENRIVGSLARDTWVRTAQGWRRIRHEKLLPDQLLAEGGKALVLPPLK
jgi:hypothetical protein